jgi:hypothetical protein
VSVGGGVVVVVVIGIGGVGDGIEQLLIIDSIQSLYSIIRV